MNNPYEQKQFKYFKLIDKKIIPCDTLVEWAQWFNQADRQIACTEFGDYVISTVFLGFPHGTCERTNLPLLFETMVFKDGDDIYMQRFASHDEACAGHNEAVEYVERFKP